MLVVDCMHSLNTEFCFGEVGCFSDCFSLCSNTPSYNLQDLFVKCFCMYSMK